MSANPATLDETIANLDERREAGRRRQAAAAGVLAEVRGRAEARVGAVLAAAAERGGGDGAGAAGCGGVRASLPGQVNNPEGRNQYSRTAAEVTTHLQEWLGGITPREMMHGHCDTWARKFKERHPEAEIVETDPYSKKNRLGVAPSHTFIKVAKRYYDAEHHEGVDDPRHLNFFSGFKGHLDLHKRGVPGTTHIKFKPITAASRVERLARAIEAMSVRAAHGAFAPGHPFYGNKWRKVGNSEEHAEFISPKSNKKFTLVFEPDYGKKESVVSLAALDSEGEFAGGAIFKTHPGDASKWSAFDVHTEDKHKRQGIASAFYSAMKEHGHFVVPSISQSESGKALWKSLRAGGHVQAAYDEGKHPRGHGGQWAAKGGGTEQGTAHADPPGAPSGKIRHAVLVIGNRRWRGPSHFQAMMAAMEKVEGATGHDVQDQGFETESGHFLNRFQAARYVGMPLSAQPGENQATSELLLRNADGQLYTQDAVQAALPPPSSELALHDAARDEARRGYQAAVNRAVGAMEAEAAADKARKDKEDAAKRKRRREELEAALLLLLAAAAATIYRATRSRLANAIPGPTPGAARLPTPAAPVAPPGGAGTAGGVTPAPGDTNAPSATLGPIAHGIGAGPDPGEAEEFAKGRSKLLEGFLKDSLARLDRVAGEAVVMEDAVELLRQEAEAIEAGQGRVVAECESQAVYGSAMIRLIKQAGFTTKVWTTVGDERVRDSHNMCEEQGEVPIDKPFHNGLQFPGDSNGGPEETANCRCWLTPGRRGK